MFLLKCEVAYTNGWIILEYAPTTAILGTRQPRSPWVALMNTTMHSSSPDAPSLDTIHSVLKNRRRRFVVDVLAGREAPIDLHVLARAITTRMPSEAEAEEAAEGEQAAAGDDLDSVAMALHHIDLPRLDQAGVANYDPEERVVEPTAAERLVPFLDAADSLR